MKKLTQYHKKLKFTYVKITVLTLFCCTFFLKGYTLLQKSGENLFHVFINNVEIGTTGDAASAQTLLAQARRNIASESEELTFIDAEMTLEGEEVLWGEVDSEKELLAKMEEALRGHICQTMQRSYTMKVNEYMVNLSSAEEVRQLLQAAIDKYDSSGNFQVELVHDTEREFSVLTTNIVDLSEQESAQDEASYSEGGVQTLISQLGADVDTGEEMDFSDYELGVLQVDFAEEVEVVEAYLPESQLTDLSISPWIRS